MGNATYHVLLVGIDHYPTGALAGCVNDIDAVQGVLLDRLHIPADRITRLAAPLDGAVHDTRVASRPPTLANLRTALAALAGPDVGADDRVIIYYSGHGGQLQYHDRRGHTFPREALVPVDFRDTERPDRLLFDFELNRLLMAITRRTAKITVMLDSCHAAGASRTDPLTPGWAARYLDLTRLFGVREALPDPDPGQRGGAQRARIARHDLDEVQVIAACLDNEYAKEGPDPHGVRHGLLTRAWIDALAGIPDADLRTTTWAAIWQAMRAQIEAGNPYQHPWMSGSAGRRVFAGEPANGDPGFPVVRAGDGYRVLAGSLAGVTPGTELAIYGEQPVYFPALGSEADRAARAGVLRVTSAELARALAAPAGPGFTLAPGARARIVAPGARARLRFAVEPANAHLEHQIAASPLFVRAAPGEHPHVRLTQVAGHWVLGDDVHGTGDAGPVLFALAVQQLGEARALLEHYYAYSLPLRLARGAGDLPDALTLDVLDCKDASDFDAATAQAGELDEVAQTAGTYVVAAGARVAFKVRNTSPRTLQVTLVNAAASGKVQLLGDHSIAPHAYHVFWASSVLGRPFEMSTPPGARAGIDRLCAIGRTEAGHELGFLRVTSTFADAVDRVKGHADKDIGDDPGRGDVRVLDHWTATQVVIETTRAA